MQRRLRWGLKGRKTIMFFGFVDCRSTTSLSRNKMTMCILWSCSAYGILKITSKVLLRFLKKNSDLKGYKNSSWKITVKNYFEISVICVVYQIKNREEVCLQYLYSSILTKTLYYIIKRLNKYLCSVIIPKLHNHLKHKLFSK